MSDSTPTLPSPRRVVTGHDGVGLATVKHDSHLTPQPVGDGCNMTLLWSTTEHPADVNHNLDNGTVNPGMPPKGSGLTAYDMPPYSKGLFHRSITLDYIIVATGTVVLGLDDGSRVTLNEGDVVVQQSTMHNWCNETDQWARLYGMMVPAQVPVINGKELEASWPY